jgi:hypothetical protein
LINEKIIANQKAGQNPDTAKPGTIYDAIITNKAFITRENIPKVRIFNGSVSKKTIGFINTLIKPSTTASTRAPIGVTMTPGIKYAVITIAIAEIIQCSSFIVISY